MKKQKLIELLNIVSIGILSCENVHHKKAHQHKSVFDECPAVNRANQLIEELLEYEVKSKKETK